jgi:hypothetical protein
MNIWNMDLLNKSHRIELVSRWASGMLWLMDHGPKIVIAVVVVHFVTKYW